MLLALLKAEIGFILPSFFARHPELGLHGFRISCSRRQLAYKGLENIQWFTTWLIIALTIEEYETIILERIADLVLDSINDFGREVCLAAPRISLKPEENRRVLAVILLSSLHMVIGILDS